MNTSVVELMKKRRISNDISNDNVTLLNKSGVTNRGILWKLNFGTSVRILSSDGTKTRAEFFFNKEYGEEVYVKINDPDFKLTFAQNEDVEKLLEELDEWCQDLTAVATGHALYIAHDSINSLVFQLMKEGLDANDAVLTSDFERIVNDIVVKTRADMGAAHECDDPLFSWTDGYLYNAIKNSMIADVGSRYETPFATVLYQAITVSMSNRSKKKER